MDHVPDGHLNMLVVPGNSQAVPEQVVKDRCKTFNIP